MKALTRVENRLGKIQCEISDKQSRVYQIESDINVRKLIPKQIAQ